MLDNTMVSKRRSWIKYGALVCANAIAACTGIFTKMASRQEFLSWQYILCLAGAISILGIYALIWQQIIKRIEISTAYMFKGTSVIFGLLIANIVLGEIITLPNIIGASIIILGITLFAKA